MTKRFRTIEISNPEYQPEGLRFTTIRSKYLNGRGDCTFFIPPQIKAIDENVPIVILLHGVYGSHWAWTFNINVHGVATRLINEGKVSPMMLVMPSDGLMGDGSGYFRHEDKDFENWIVKDVVDLIGEVIPHKKSDRRLFIAGLSMGGYGALRLMAKYPSLFSGGSGLSSITSLKDLLPFLSRAEQTYYKAHFKSEELISYLTKNRKKLPSFRFDCGVDDVLIRSNRRLHEQLSKLDVPHVFEEFPGEHSNEYWTENIGKTLQFFDEILKR